MREVFWRNGAARRTFKRGNIIGLLSVAFILGGGTSLASADTYSVKQSNIDATRAGIQPVNLLPSTSYEINWVEDSFEREYNWRLEKTGHLEEVTLGQNSATADLEYRVSAVPDGYSEIGRQIRSRASFKNNLAPKTIYPKATVFVGGVAVHCESEIILGEGSFVGPSGTRQIVSTCDIPSHLDSKDISIHAWVEWERLGQPNGTAGDNVRDGVLESVREKRYESVTVVDDKAETGQEYVLGTAKWNSSGNAEVFEYNVEKTGLDTGHCTTISNQAKIEDVDKKASHQIKVCPDAELTIDSTVDATYDRIFEWSLTKSGSLNNVVLLDDDALANLDYKVSATPDGYTDSNTEVSGQITIYNPNTRGAKKLTVTNTLSIGSTKKYCDIKFGEDENPHNVWVGPGATATFSYLCELAGPVPSDVTSTAKVIWDEGREGEGETETTSDVVFQLDDVLNEQVHVYDDKTVPGDQHFIGSADWHAGVSEFEYGFTSENLPRGECSEITNNAWIDAVSAEDSATVEVCPEADLTIQTRVDATMDRLYMWDLTTTGTLDEVTIEGDTASASIDYAVIATPAGFENINPQISGQIEVTNPNKFGDAIPATITDTLDIGADLSSCEVTYSGAAATDIPVAPQETVTFDYACDTGKSVPDAVTNKATVAWGNENSAEATVSAEFQLADEYNRNVTVFSDKTSPGSEHELGVATWNDTGKSTVFEYPLTRQNLSVGECTDVVNTAWIDGLDAQESATVTVCTEKEEQTTPATEEDRAAPTGEERAETPSAGAESTPRNSLPATGGAIAATVWTALVFTAIGATFLVLTRRRKI